MCHYYYILQFDFILPVGSWDCDHIIFVVAHIILYTATLSCINQPASQIICKLIRLSAHYFWGLFTWYTIELKERKRCTVPHTSLILLLQQHCMSQTEQANNLDCSLRPCSQTFDQQTAVIQPLSADQWPPPPNPWNFMDFYSCTYPEGWKAELAYLAGP